MIHRLALLLLIGVVCLQGISVFAEPPAMEVRRQSLEKLADGTEIESFTLVNGRGLEASVMTMGATLMSVSFPDRAGKSAVLTLPAGSPEKHQHDASVAGSVVGRYANRIAGAKFTIDGVEYKLEANAARHHIHGGKKSGYQQLVWKAEPLREANAVGVQLSLTSPDGQGGYPGTAQVRVIYKVTADNELVMDYSATTDKPTHINLTNHAYWNLAGIEGGGDVMGHLLTLGAERYLPADEALIPTGEIKAVKEVPALDFTAERSMGSRLSEMPKKLYDLCYVVRKSPAEKLSMAARVEEPTSGRVMEVWTTQPGVQFYTGNPKAFCLETQHYPDSPNRPEFPSTLLRPGETYHEVTVHRFSVKR